MKKVLRTLLLTIVLVALSGPRVFAAPNDADTHFNYFVDGIKYRGEGKCEDAIKSYQMARRHKQFKEDWAYHLAVADCYVALKRYDEGIDAYTRVLEGTKNKAMQAEMYKGRGKAYYFKAVGTNTLDKKYLELAQKDLQSAKSLGADVSDIEKSMSADMALKPVDAKATDDSKRVVARPVTIVEGPDKLVIGEGEYVLFLSSDTEMRDKNGQPIAASEIRPGDIVDFTYVTSYLNKADGMLHCSAKSLTLARVVSAKAGAPDNNGKVSDNTAGAVYYREVSQKLDNIEKNLKEMSEKKVRAAKVKPAIKRAKVKRKKPKIVKKQEAEKKSETEKKPAEAEQPQVNRKPSEW
ncbi:MAG TPA: tetratricopeptide repeat protein [Dissulfurispiraceae bacterium]